MPVMNVAIATNLIANQDIVRFLELLKESIVAMKVNLYPNREIWRVNTVRTARTGRDHQRGYGYGRRDRGKCGSRGRGRGINLYRRY